MSIKELLKRRRGVIPRGRTSVGQVVHLTRVQQVLKLPEHSAEKQTQVEMSNERIESERDNIPKMAKNQFIIYTMGLKHRQTY